MSMLADHLATMRATVDQTLTDACTINEEGTDSLNPATGAYTHAAGAQVFAGPCRFGSLDTSDRVVEVGGEPVSLRTYKLRLPWDTIGIEVDQVVTVTTSNDPYLQGRSRLRVIDVHGMTDPLSRSVIVQDNLG